MNRVKNRNAFYGIRHLAIVLMASFCVGQALSSGKDEYFLEDLLSFVAPHPGQEVVPQRSQELKALTLFVNERTEGNFQLAAQEIQDLVHSKGDAPLTTEESTQCHTFSLITALFLTDYEGVDLPFLKRLVPCLSALGPCQKGRVDRHFLGLLRSYQRESHDLMWALSQDPDSLTLKDLTSMSRVVGFLRAYENQGLGDGFLELEALYRGMLEPFSREAQELMQSELRPVFYDSNGNDRPRLQEPHVAFVLQTGGRVAALEENQRFLNRAENWQERKQSSLGEVFEAPRTPSPVRVSKKRGRHKKGNKGYHNDHPAMNNGRGRVRR